MLASTSSASSGQSVWISYHSMIDSQVHIQSQDWPEKESLMILRSIGRHGEDSQISVH